MVTFVCDSGNKYLSKVFNDHWLADQGLTDRAAHGDLRDLIARAMPRAAPMTVGPDDTLLHRLQAHAHRRRQPAAGAATTAG